MNSNNHGKVGRALYLKFTLEKFPYKKINGAKVKDGDIFNDLDGRNAVPIHIDNTTQGEYECVCEFGTEIH